MGIGITQEQRELADAVRGWVARAVPPEAVRKLLDAPPQAGARPGYWDGMCAQGLVTPHLEGGTLLDLAVVVEEAARAALPGAFLPSALASVLLDRAGAEPLDGRVGAVALGAGGVTAVAAEGGGWRLDGLAPPVLGAGEAELVLLAAEGAGGVRWFAVDAAALEVRPHESADPTRPTAEVRAHGVTVPAERLLGLDEALVRDLACVLFAADACGTAAWAVHTAAEHAKTREQFGRPVGRFQGVKHLCADMLVRLEQARALAWDAANSATPPPGDAPGGTPGGTPGEAPGRLPGEASGAAPGEAPGRLPGEASGEASGEAIGQAPSGTPGETPGQAPGGTPASEAPSGTPGGAPSGTPGQAPSGTSAEAPSGTPGGAPRHASPHPSDVRSLVAALAAATALDAAWSCAKDCIQILGGIGFTWEHDAHIHLRRALVARQLLGPGDAHRLRAVRLAAAGARRELRLELPAEAEAHRPAARAAIGAARGLDPAAARRLLAPTGYANPHLPPPYGRGAGPAEQIVIQQELKEAGVKVADLGIATWIVPSLIAFGSEEQREAYVLPTLRGDTTWCQLFSEPGAGSDLASLRTRADRTADGSWRINGQKVWTSSAHTADFGILLARTDPQAPKHKGLGYFVVDMRNTPGIEIRPLKEITGDSLFNEVWFEDVLLPAGALVGAADGGWKAARNTLGNERVHMADQMTFDSGLETLIAASSGLDASYGARIGALAAEAHALACIGLRTTLQQVSGLEPGAGASVRKLVQTPHQQRTAELALELLGPAGAVREGAGERAVHGMLMSRCLTIAGGTTQVQLNVVAERILGLPRD
ncbi:alkylation response protein AidB-like acyl-CoA dehydrogenase [Streptomyces sp. 3211.6]|uniref:acyl-CoA dehydrogenase n=1 Tax=Streptomyces sp. 3211.6 TaxID=1938845 RepID=UPI000EB249DD|nr:acyl-CoA dehydrogenase family protein [Streptomyces sp. 3211.6]RKT04453.1 alkylation response protein AidB-like acyl-CoA dehydrogenase [Streptomyces sp. 3211.6]